MAYYVNPTYLDLALDGIANVADRVFVCSEFPTTYTEASATYMLVSITTTVAVGGGDFTKGDGINGGRRLTLLTQLAATVTNTGSATHIAICKSTATSAVLLVLPCVTTPIVAAQSLDLDDLTFTIGDPVS